MTTEPTPRADCPICARDAAKTLTEAHMTTPTPTPCSFPPCDTGPGEPCSRHEREWAHAEGEHELCGPECTAGLRQRIETALDQAGLACFSCTCATGAADGCEDCAKDRGDIVDVVLPLVAAERAAARGEGRIAGLNESAAYARSRSVSNWGKASGSPSTVLCTVSDELYARAGAVHQDGQP